MSLERFLTYGENGEFRCLRRYKKAKKEKWLFELIILSP